MLVLTRRPGQVIEIGEGIIVEVVRVEPDHALLAIFAPRREDRICGVREPIPLGAGIEIEVLEVKPSCAQIGIRAPREVRVSRPDAKKRSHSKFHPPQPQDQDR